MSKVGTILVGKHANENHTLYLISVNSQIHSIWTDQEEAIIRKERLNGLFGSRNVRLYTIIENQEPTPIRNHLWRDWPNLEQETQDNFTYNDEIPF